MLEISVLSGTWERILSRENIIYDSCTVEQFLNFFIELFNQGVSHSALVFAKLVVAHVLRIKH